MPLTIIRHDITKLSVDAIVNAANPRLLPGAGVCETIFNEAGYDELSAACEALAPVPNGQAVITPGFRLQAKYVIHAVGPRYQDGRHGESEILRQAYLNSLILAESHGCQSIAFPLIANGVYGYPAQEALTIATTTIRTYLNDHDLDVTLVVYNRNAFQISKSLLGDIKSYLDEHFIGDLKQTSNFRRDDVDVERPMFRLSEIESYQSTQAESLDDVLDRLDESFTEALLKLIDQKGLSDPQVYKRANMTRQHFSKIRSNPHYVPSKTTAIALAIALQLSLSETENLLRKAGMALSTSSKFDVIITFFISSRKYAIDEINQALFEYDQPILGSLPRKINH